MKLSPQNTSNKLNTFALIRDLSTPASIVFSCALMQRMLPNYQLFCKATGFGDAHLAQSILNLVWEWCMSPQNKFNAGVQLEKLEEVIPEVDDFDIFAVYPALDYCMALSSILQSFMKEHEHAAVTIAKLSQGSVEAYILAGSEETLSNDEIKQDPLMQFEIETQQSLLAFVSENKVSKELVKALRTDLLNENMSNLGLSGV